MYQTLGHDSTLVGFDMALMSLGETRWRMIRRVLKKKKFRYDDARNMTRNDQKQFDWLVENGFVSRLAEDVYELTDKARAAADLGEYNWEPPARVAPPPKPGKKAAKPKKG